MLDLLIVLAWGGAAVFLVTGAGALGAAATKRQRAACALAAVAITGGFAFSWIAGFSIGRLTALAPLLLAGVVAAWRSGGRAVLAAAVAALAAYWLLAWRLIGVEASLAQTVPGLAWLIGPWGIDLEWLLCLAALAWSYRAGGRSSPSRGWRRSP